MTEKSTRRRRRRLLVPLLGVGMAAWAVRSRWGGRRAVQDGWKSLPPRPVAQPRHDPIEQAPVEAAPVDEPPVEEAPAEAAEPVLARARAVPAAAAVASVTAPALPDAPFGAGSVRANADGSSPDAEHVVKGKTGTRVFYAPGSPYYSRTRADVWFRTADDARAAGFAARAPRGSG